MRRLIPPVVAVFVFAYASAADAATYYIDYANGMNSNAGTSQASPWKTHPYMEHASACDGGSGPAYTHEAGDKFIFKGGVSWPAACFQLTVAAGGTSNANDYYGVDTSWYAGGWFTRATFDAAQTDIGHFFYLGSIGYVTIDNIEMKNQNLGSLSFGAAEAIFAQGSIGNVVENVYIHDFMTTLQMSDALGSTDYSAGGIQGYVTLLNSIIDDSGGFGFNSSGTKISGGNIGGACQGCREVSNTKFVADVAACFGVTLCHDSEFTGINQSIQDAADPNGYNLHDTAPKYARKHSQAIEDENEIGGFTAYNNWLHDNAAGIYISVGYKGSQVYNNVLNNNSGGPWPIEFATTGGDTSSTHGYAYNNTIDCNGSGTPSMGLLVYGGHTGIAGELVIENNISVNCPGGAFQTSATGTVTQGNDYAMASSEAVTYGFVAANEYAPTSSNPNVTGQGANLTSACSGPLAPLCSDTEGATWYGGSAVARPTGTAPWTLGAYAWPLGAKVPPPEDAGVDSGGDAGGSCLMSNGNWSNTSIATQSGPFTVTFNATPSGSVNANGDDAVVGLSMNAASAYTDLVANVRFNSSGQIDVHNGGTDGGAYGTDTMPYTTGTTYAITMTVDLASQTYDVMVGTTKLATGYGFRTGASTLAFVDVEGSASASISVCDVTIPGSPAGDGGSDASSCDDCNNSPSSSGCNCDAAGSRTDAGSLVSTIVAAALAFRRRRVRNKR